MPYCPKCGREVSEEDFFCPICGQALSRATVQVPVTQVPGTPERFKKRPMGVTILAVLEVLSGIIYLGLGLLVFVMAGIVRRVGFRALIGGLIDVPFRIAIPAFIVGLMGAIGGIMVVIGVINFVIAYGYWGGRGWAWTIGLIFAILGIILGLISLPGGVVRIFIDAVIIYYLTRPYVKRFFGKEPIQVTV